MNTPALIRGDDGGLHVRQFSSQEDAAKACAAHETSLFPTMTPDVMCRLIRVARCRRIERKGAWLTALENFLAAVACRAEERVLVFSSAMGTVGLADEIRRVIEPHLRGGWTVKHVATGSNLVVFVLEEPKEKPVVEAE